MKRILALGLVLCGLGSFVSWLYLGHLFVSGRIVVKQGPPLLTASKMSELVTVKVQMRESLEARNNWYEGCWLVEGDALIGSDCSRVAIMHRDDDQRYLTLRLPEPRVISVRVNHERTRSVGPIRSISWNPAQLLWGNREEILENAMKEAQAKLEKCAHSTEHIAQGKEQAESILAAFYSQVAWKVTINWQSGLDYPHGDGTRLHAANR